MIFVYNRKLIIVIFKRDVDTRKSILNLNEEFKFVLFSRKDSNLISPIRILYFHICDMLNPITTHPQLHPSCLVHQKSFNHLYEGHEMFRALCRVFNPFSIQSFSRSIVAVNWRWIWMYVRFCRTCELPARGWICETRLAGFDRWQTGFYFVATVSFLRYIVTILFTIWVWSGIEIFCYDLLRVCWMHTRRTTLENEKKYFKRWKEFVGWIKLLHLINKNSKRYAWIGERFFFCSKLKF